MTETQIDWDAASFESGEDERARREREAMEALNARLAERDAQRGLVPTSEAVFPPDLMPPAQAPQRPLPAPPGMLAAPTPGDLGPSSPPPNPSPLDPGPPAISTSPQPPEPTAEASTNPEAQTSTAGAQAANLRRQGPQQPAPGSVDELMAQERRRMEQEQALQRPTSVHAQPPTAAMPGPTGLPSTRTAPLAPISGQTGIETGAAPAMAAMQAQRDEPTFDERREMAREEDVRRRRIRGILMGLAGLMGMRTIGSGGSAGGALPGLIAAGMVRRPDEEETLLEGDERSREIGAQEAEQASVAQRLRQQQEAQAAEERARQERLLFDYRKLQGDQEDRSMRTGIQLRENEREEELLQPESAVSARERAALRSSLANQPREVQQAYPSEMLDGLSATELRSIRDQLERGGRARTIAGSGRTGEGAYASTAAAGGTAGAGIAPAWYVTQVAEGNGRAPGQETAEDYQTANEGWAQFSPERRAQMETANSQAGSETIAVTNIMERAGYEQAVGGHIPAAHRDRAMAANSTRDAINAQVSRGLRALDQFGGQGWWEAGTGLVADFFGSNANDAIAAYNSARSGVMSQLAIARGAGVIGEAEYGRFVREMPDVSSVAGLIGAARSMQQIANEINANAEAVIGAAGYRPIQGDGARRHGLSYRPGQGGGGGRAEQQPAQQPQRQRGVVLRFRAPDGSVRATRPLNPSQVEAARRRLTSAGYEEVTQ